jgi:hypothetical protein
MNKITLRILLSGIVVAAVSHARAQSTAAPDRRDYMLSALQAQRNAALDTAAMCQGDSGMAVEQLRQENAILTKNVADLDKQVTDLKAKIAAANEAKPKE